MSLTVYTVREVKEDAMDQVLDVFGSASNAVAFGSETLGDNGSSPAHVAKIAADTELRSQLRKTGEVSLTSEDGTTTLVLNKQPVK